MLHVLADLEKLHFLERDYRVRCSSARTGDPALVRIGGRHLAHVLALVVLLPLPPLVHRHIVPQPHALRMERQSHSADSRGVTMHWQYWLNVRGS